MLRPCKFYNLRINRFQISENVIYKIMIVLFQDSPYNEVITYNPLFLNELLPFFI